MQTTRAFLSVAILSTLLLGHIGPVQAADPDDVDQDQTEQEQAYDMEADGEQRAKAAGESLIGQPGPEMNLTTLDGETIDLASLYGETPVYIKFWATWCVPCRQQMPGFQKFQEEHGDDIQVIAVNTGYADTAEAAAAYRDEMGLTMPITVDDGTLGEALNLRVTPQHVLIDRSGHIAYIGHRDDQELEQALQAVLEQDDQQSSTTEEADVADNDADTLKVGQAVTDLAVTTWDGNTIDLSRANSDKPLGVVFFATWCESYLAESKPETATACRRVRETVNQLSEDEEVQWVGIISGLWTKESDVESYLATTETDIPVVLDAEGELHRAFDIRQIPSVVLISADGQIAEKLGPQDTTLTTAVERLGQ